MGEDTVSIWDSMNGELQSTLEGHSNVVTYITLSPDGTKILPGSYDSLIRGWEADNGAPMDSTNS